MMMKRIAYCIMALLMMAGMTQAQESKSEKKERHKKYWKKVGTDTRDFWKGEHEKKVKKDAERKKKRSESGEPASPKKSRKKDAVKDAE